MKTIYNSKDFQFHTHKKYPRQFHAIHSFERCATAHKFTGNGHTTSPLHTKEKESNFLLRYRCCKQKRKCRIVQFFILVVFLLFFPDKEVNLENRLTNRPSLGRQLLDDDNIVIASSVGTATPTTPYGAKFIHAYYLLRPLTRIPPHTILYFNKPNFCNSLPISSLSRLNRSDLGHHMHFPLVIRPKYPGVEPVSEGPAAI